MSLVLGFANRGLQRDGCPSFFESIPSTRILSVGIAREVRMWDNLFSFFVMLASLCFSGSLAIDDEQTIL